MVEVAKYERTNDKGRMLTSGPIAQAIINAVRRKFANQEPESNIFDVLPGRAATSMRYGKGAKTAMVWDDGKTETKIDLPLKDGWYDSDGNPFGVPNGKPSTRDDPDALYLYRHQDRKFSGPVGLGDFIGFGGGRRGFYAYDVWCGSWSDVSGVALVEGREATTRDVKVVVSGSVLDLSAAAFREAPKPANILTLEVSAAEATALLTELENALKVVRPEVLEKVFAHVKALQIKE